MRGHRRARLVHPIRAVTIVCLLGLGLTACTRSSGSELEAAQTRVADAQKSVDDATTALEQANTAFCSETKDYVTAVDRYGKVFDEKAATVGDVTTLGSDLAQPRDSTTSAAQDVLDAHDALNAANLELADAQSALAVATASASGKPEKTPSPTENPPSSSPGVPSASVDRVRQAEADLEAASTSITDQTPLVQAGQTFTSAAFALEMAWLNLFADAGCLTDEKSKEVAAALRDYTSALQTDLKTAGYYTGKVDGVYGPQTEQAVEDLQKATGLPVTGLVDRATRAALDQAVAGKGQDAAAEDVIEATSVQTTLKLAGYWDGPVDGEWTPELTAALKQFQKALGVPPTGAVDAATLAALEATLAAKPPPSKPTPSPTTGG
jgi:murein L,D-transpeptidase YcbB/YkuD